MKSKFWKIKKSKILKILKKLTKNNGQLFLFRIFGFCIVDNHHAISLFTIEDFIIDLIFVQEFV